MTIDVEQPRTTVTFTTRVATVGRSLVVLLYALTVTPAALTGMTVLGLLGRLLRSDRTWWWLCRAWARGFIGCCGVRVIDRAELERAFSEVVAVPSRPVVVMSNHASYLDTLIWMTVSRVPLLFAAKRELYWIPFFGQAMWATGQIKVARDRASQSRESLNRIADRLRQRGGIAVFYPEGTRSRTGALLPLKVGGFHLAIQSGAVVVPMAHAGTRQIWPRTVGAIHAGAVAIAIGARIDPAALAITGGADAAPRNALRARVVVELGALVDAAHDTWRADAVVGVGEGR